MKLSLSQKWIKGIFLTENPRCFSSKTWANLKNLDDKRVPKYSEFDSGPRSVPKLALRHPFGLGPDYQ